ncbi:MAG: hypothetical protein MPN21_22775 [Thermoanaerobaculia bacterium]|nr:hypothetical protein [Thermoanaerobaculia bacterium]
MWTLIKAQFRYHALWLSLVLLPLLVFGAIVTGRSVQAGRVSALWMLWTMVGGMLAQIALFYYSDLRERRALLWITLPLSPGQVSAARLVVPLFVHLPMLAFAFLAIAVLSPGALTSETVGEVLAGNGLAMLVTYSIYAGEEVGIRLAHRRGLFWLSQLGFAGLMVWVALDPLDWFPELDQGAGVAGLHGAALVCAVAAYRLYVGRTSFLVGTDPTCGLPIDWSRSD